MKNQIQNLIYNYDLSIRRRESYIKWINQKLRELRDNTGPEYSKEHNYSIHKYIEKWKETRKQKRELVNILKHHRDELKALMMIGPIR